MRLYLSPDGRQYLADFRADGFPGKRDVALGTADPARAATVAANKLAELFRCALPSTTGAAQLALPSSSSDYRISRALSDFVERRRHRSDATKDMHRRHMRLILDALEAVARDPAVEALAVADPALSAVSWYRVGEALQAHWLAEGRQRKRAEEEEGAFSPMTRDTVNKRLSTLSGALKYAWQCDHMREPPKMPERLASETVPRERWLTPEEIGVMVQQVAVHESHFYTPQMRAGRAARIVLRSWTGLSNGDARRLRVAAFNLVRGVWYRPRRTKTAARTAGAQGVELPMPSPMHAAVQQWLDVANLRPVDPILYPWPDEYRGLNMYARAAGIPPLTPNDFRRTAAHLLRLCGYDKDFCRRWLGHSAESEMLDRVYLQDDPLAVEDVRMVNQLHNRLRVLPGGAPSDQTSSGPPRKALPAPDSRGRGREERSEMIQIRVPRDRVELSTHGFSVLPQPSENKEVTGAVPPESSSVPPQGPPDSSRGGGK